MIRSTRCTLATFLPLIVITGGLIAAESPKPVDPPEPDPTKPRYIKTDDPHLITYAKQVYLNNRVLKAYLLAWQSQKQRVRALRRELEEYKRETKQDPAVLRYFEEKLKKEQDKEKHSLKVYQQNQDDIVEYGKTDRVPTWLVEEYKKKMRENDKPSSP